MPKKKFDKKKAVTFQLVHRSQQDPLVVDDTAPQRVLLPLEEKQKKDKEKRLEEQHKYGIFYDDDFNYLHHLKDVKDNRMVWPKNVDDEIAKQLEKTRLKLPSSVFATEFEEETGMLNKATPSSGLQLNLDPDIVAAMDEDFNFSDPENQLEDNFVELANGIASDQEYENEIDGNELDFYSDNEELDEVESLSESQNSFEEEETKSRFTNYSMTSSVIRRNGQLTLLDERFEKMYDDYQENEIGALECEEIEGHVPASSEILLQFADDFEKQCKRVQMDKQLVDNKIKETLQWQTVEKEQNEEYETIPVQQKEKWDCESILSTYSNIYNHPKMITEKKDKIVIDKRSGIPKNVIGSSKLTTKSLNKLNEQYSDNKGPAAIDERSVISQLSAFSFRPKNETPEDRKERKKQLKEYRRERRLEKKLNTEAFREEAKRQVKIAINNRNNIQGNKIL